MSPIRFEQCPWLVAPWKQLGAYIASERVPQALLLAGVDGVGKGRLAEAFARRLLCRESNNAYACGQCSACVLLEAGNHPDFLRIEPIEAGKPISVDAIRGLIASLSLTPQYRGRRVVILRPADQMTVAAANSLLKTLEEPDAHTSLLLISESPERLPPTIRSRCQRLQIDLPERQPALDWLRREGCGGKAEVLLTLGGGGPFRALAYRDDESMQARAAFFQTWSEVLVQSKDPVLAAEAWHKHACEQLLDWLNTWTCDLARLGADAGFGGIDNEDLRNGLQALAVRLELKGLFQFRDLLAESRHRLAGQANRQMVLEDVLIHWSRLSAKREERKRHHE